MINFIYLSTSLIALLVLAGLIAFIACKSIIVEKNGNWKLKWLMFAMFFGIFNYYLINVFVISGLIIHIPFLLRGFVPLVYITQPAIYFYVVVNLNEKYVFSKKDLLHLIPALYAIIDNYRFYSGGPDHWQYWANSIADNYGNIANYQGTIVKAKYNYVFRVLLNISYTLFAWRYYLKNIQLNKETKNQFVLKWLKLFLIIITIYVFTISAATLYYSTIISSKEMLYFHMQIPLFIIGLLSIVLGSYIFFNPILLYGLPKINFKTVIDNEKSLSKYKTIQNENDEIDKSEFNLAVTIISEIKEKKLYKNIYFSLAEASNYFSIQTHHISFLINKYIKKSFPDIVCEMRIDHAIELLKDNKNNKYTMEAIGSLSGFNSKTTFYVSFKKITGFTPNEYIQNAKA